MRKRPRRGKWYSLRRLDRYDVLVHAAGQRVLEMQNLLNSYSNHVSSHCYDDISNFPSKWHGSTYDLALVHHEALYRGNGGPQPVLCFSEDD